MGFNSVVLVMNDAVSWIEKDPEFGKHLAETIRHTYGMEGRKGFAPDVPAYEGRGVFCNAATVLGQDHADGDQVYYVHANSGERIRYDRPPRSATALEAMAWLLKQHGYKVTKPRTPKEPK